MGLRCLWFRLGSGRMGRLPRWVGTELGFSCVVAVGLMRPSVLNYVSSPNPKMSRPVACCSARILKFRGLESLKERPSLRRSPVQVTMALRSFA